MTKKEPNEADLKKVTEIFISNLNGKGEIINTDISELVKLTNLKSLGLKGFDLNETVVNIINRFSELVQLKLYRCHTKEPISIDIDTLKSLILDNCSNINFSNIRLPESVLIVDGGIVDIAKMQKSKLLKELEIKNSEIVNSRELKELQELKDFNADGSTLDDDDILDILKAKNISVSHGCEYNPMR